VFTKFATHEVCRSYSRKIDIFRTRKSHHNIGWQPATRLSASLNGLFPNYTVKILSVAFYASANLDCRPEAYCSSVCPSVRSFLTNLVNTAFWEWMRRFRCKLAYVVPGSRAWKGQLLRSGGQRSHDAEVRFGDLAVASCSTLAVE